MITIKDLDEAIAECQGQPHPNSNTCIKLAAYLIIKNLMFEDEKINTINRYSGSENNIKPALNVNSDFAKKIENKSINEILVLFNEVMETLQIVEPRLYASVMLKL